MNIPSHIKKNPYKKVKLIELNNELEVLCENIKDNLWKIIHEKKTSPIQKARMDLLKMKKICDIGRFRLKIYKEKKDESKEG